MNIKKIELTNTMGHASYGLNLPDSGVVLVTGPNGCGKSSIVEALPIAMWGKTLRGTNPWHTKKKCNAAVTIDNYLVSRARKGARSSVEVSDSTGADIPEFDTASKAQDWLQHIFGSFDAWRRTHVFSSHDASHFTLATDAERKRLLESLLELSKFDGASAALKVDLKEKKRVHQVLDSAVIRLRDRVNHLTDESGRLAEQLEDIGDASTEELEKRERKLGACIQEWEADLADYRESISALKLAGADQRAELKSKLRQLAAIDHAECPTCGQEIGEDITAPIRESINALKSNLEATQVEHADSIRTETAEAQELDRELRTHRADAREVHARITSIKQAARQREDLVARIEGAADRVQAAKDDLETQEVELAAESARLAELEGVGVVLGLRGVRSHILGKTLSGLEAVANAWLSRIAGPVLEVSLSPVTEKKTGGVSDAIQLNVIGAGGGHGYRAASGGERRRIDVAILLALADISAANSETHGRTGGTGQGTLFFDEVFDTLDSDGLESVIAITHELAKDRAVVVISHSEELAAKLNPTVHVKL